MDEAFLEAKHYMRGSKEEEAANALALKAAKTFREALVKDRSRSLERFKYHITIIIISYYIILNY